MVVRKLLAGFAVLALGASITASVATALSPCSRKACRDLVAASGLSGNAKSACFKEILTDCNAGACSCTGGGGTSLCSCCGDGRCGNLEDCAKCPQDCGPCSCGNGVCEASQGEDCSTCPRDCGPCSCGNGVCEPSQGESCSDCPQDCGPCCGNASASECNGMCSAAGEICRPFGGSCHCVLNSCSGGDYPQCDGSCPAGQRCFNSGTGCNCYPDPCSGSRCLCVPPGFEFTGFACPLLCPPGNDQCGFCAEVTQEFCNAGPCTAWNECPSGDACIDFSLCH